MKVSESNKVKEILISLEKSNKLNVLELKERIDFTKIDSTTRNLIASKLDAKKAETKVSFREENFPIYREQKEWKIKNSTSKLIKGSKEGKYYSSIRTKFRKLLENKAIYFNSQINFNLDGISIKDVENFKIDLDKICEKINVYKIETFLGSTSNPERLKEWEKIVKEFPKTK